DVLRTMFGGIIRPAGLLPRWYTEGLAVEMESRYTLGGRGRGLVYPGLVRAEVEGGYGGSETIDRIGMTSIPSWPFGSRPYTYGYYLMNALSNYTAEKEEIYATLDHRYGGRFPWILNGPAEDYFDQGWQGVLDRMYSDVR